MRFSLLGPLVVTASSGDRAMLGGPRLRILLAALLLHPNVPISTGELAEIVWDGSPPPKAVSTLRSYVRRLRQALGDDATRIAAHGPAYLIRIDPSELDILEFEALCRDTRSALRAGEWSEAAVAGAQALRLWRAAPLLDVPAEALRSEFVPRLERLRLQVTEDCFDAGLELGRHKELVSQLANTVAQHPLQERFHAQLMLALAGNGQRAEALRAYRTARRLLVDELGLEPGPELRDIHRQILAGDPELATGTADDPAPSATPDTASSTSSGTHSDVADDAAAQVPVQAPVQASAGPTAGPAAPSSTVPSELPADIADFTGRDAEVARLCDVLTQPDSSAGPGAVPLAVVVGAAGLGKTTLAVHVAHRIRHRFPDGQLYLDLSGASAEPMTANDALARFLRDLGVNDADIPAGEQERAALYRTRLTDRRMLIVLDDAPDTAHLRSLLPGTASCAVLVTTRNRAPSLGGIGLVDLETLSPPEALAMFTRIVADTRPAAEREATAQVLAACAGLPLAIRICAARLAVRRRWRIATMADRLRDERRRLDELRVDDLAVRASFRISYDSLAAGATAADLQRTFRLLGLWSGAWISLPAAAALLGVPDDDAAEALEALVDVHLVESPAPDRYQFHDLLRLFATERAQAEEPEELRLEAVQRMLHWYLQTTTAAADCIAPTRYRLPADAPNTTSSPLIHCVDDALTWFDEERANIVTAVRQAAAAGLHELAWRLPTSAQPLFNRRSSWAESATVQHIAVQAARAAGSRGGEGWALHCLGASISLSGQVDFSPSGQAEALSYLDEALAVRQECGDAFGQIQTALSIADVHYRLRELDAAYKHSLSLLDLLHEVNDPTLLATGLNNLGSVCYELGRLDEAATYYQQALGAVLPSDTYTRGPVLGNLGEIHLSCGRLDEAIAALTESQAIHRESGNRLEQARVLQHLGTAYRAAGDNDRAGQVLREALGLFEDLKSDAEVDTVRAELADLASSDASKDTAAS